MEKQNSNNQMKQFINDFNRSVYHPILNRDIGQPNLNKHILFFLLLPKLNGEKWTAETNSAAIAVGAVYKAFDAHDEVDVFDVSTTEQQLKVLSGDFLSGIYYQMIAELTNYDFIYQMSTTIGKINEIKTEYHVHSDLNEDDYLSMIQQIQTDCTVQFFKAYGYEKYCTLAEIGIPLLSLLEREQNKGTMSNDWIFEHKHTKKIIDQLINQMDHVIKKSDFLAAHLEEEIKEMTMPLLDKMV